MLSYIPKFITSQSFQNVSLHEEAHHPQIYTLSRWPEFQFAQLLDAGLAQNYGGLPSHDPDLGRYLAYGCDGWPWRCISCIICQGDATQRVIEWTLLQVAWVWKGIDQCVQEDRLSAHHWQRLAPLGEIGRENRREEGRRKAKQLKTNWDSIKNKLEIRLHCNCSFDHYWQDLCCKCWGLQRSFS